MARIVVTGGAGYIASKLLPNLSAIASRVFIVDKKPMDPLLKAQLGPKFHFAQKDLSIDDGLSEIYGEADIIIHLAALVGYPICDAYPKEAWATNVTATELLMRRKKPEARVIFSSTISNYGGYTSLVDETTPLFPLSLYGETKKRAEEIIAQDPKNIIFRFAGAFGVAPRMRFDNLVHDFCWKAVSGEKLEVYESHFIRQFIHVEDMANAIVFAVEHWDAMQGEIYNVGNPEIEITKKDVIDLIKKYYPAFQFEFSPGGHDKEKRNYPVSFQKICRNGFRLTRNLEEGISEILEYLLATTKKETSYDSTIKAA